ncbi:MAG TPA: PEP-CTERM sorting domain-containing protein [Rhizomicrobium sp.]|nr:PEP-CTERM sorting domain-containing protein [Rhizomicrobium sp.]
MKQFASKTAAVAICALGLFAAALPASAGVLTYNFNLDQCTGGCGLSNYGSVTVTDVAGGGVTVHLALLNVSGLISSGALDHHSLVFNLSGAPAATITGLPSFWSYTGPTSYTPNSGFFGTFDYIINCNAACAPNNPYTSPLDFAITTASITTASFIDGGTAAHAFFVGDISNPNGGNALTGRIGATLSNDPPPTNVPEPLTASLFGAGLIGVTALRRRKARKQL